MTANTSPTGSPKGIDQLFKNNDTRLREKAEKAMDERQRAGLDGLVGDLAAVIINTEPDHQQAAAEELLRFTGATFDRAYDTPSTRVCLLRNKGGVDFLVTSRANGANPFQPASPHPKTLRLPSTRLETFVFETPDIEAYTRIQKARGVSFLTDEIVKSDGFSFIQTSPSPYTGNSIGLIQWHGERGDYSCSQNKDIDWHLEKPTDAWRRNIQRLDHAATRVRAEDRDPAILEFISLTNFHFAFSIYTDCLNSITNVSRMQGGRFALVFTSGISPFADEEQSGPTEKFVHNYGPRVHHLAFHTEQIEETFAALKADDMEFLLELTGSPEEGLKQTFSAPSPHTFLVNEYIYRYAEFSGFFTKENVADLTKATGAQ